MQSEARPPAEHGARVRFIVLSATVVFIALAVRLLYVLTADVEYPISGDINQYALYAWNLTHRGTFSTSMPDDTPVVPDSYRGPGYPLLLAATMTLAGHSDLPVRPGPGGRSVLGYATDTWMSYALYVQVVLGALTTLLAMLLAAMWLSRAFVLCVGLTVALWPHLVTFTGVLLSETLFAFSVVLSLWLLCEAQKTGRRRLMACAALSFGAGYLINPVIAIFPILAAAVLYLRSQRQLALTLVLIFGACMVGWGLRNHYVVNGNGMATRAAENFVVGSWPQFYAAYNSRFDNEISAQIMEAERHEYEAIAADPAQGWVNMRARMSMDPGYYARWYLWDKPYLFWDWAIRIGSRDIYFVKTSNSPFDRYAILRAVESVAWALNPALFFLALSAVILIIFKLAKRREAVEGMPAMLALVFAYVTFVHTILQAEPRYSIPFRTVEMLLAWWAVAQIVMFVSNLRAKGARDSRVLASISDPNR